MCCTSPDRRNCPDARAPRSPGHVAFSRTGLANPYAIGPVRTRVAWFARIGHADTTGFVLVHPAVAVVVDRSIAGLEARRYFADAGSKTASICLARSRSRSAKSDAQGARRPAVA